MALLGFIAVLVALAAVVIGYFTAVAAINQDSAKRYAFQPLTLLRAMCLLPTLFFVVIARELTALTTSQ